MPPLQEPEEGATDDTVSAERKRKVGPTPKSAPFVETATVTDASECGGLTHSISDADMKVAKTTLSPKRQDRLVVLMK